MGGTCGTHERGERNVYTVLMGKPEGKRPLRTPRRRWEDGIRMGLGETGWGSVDWIQLAQDRDRWRALVNTVMNLRVLAPRSKLVILFCFSHTYRYFIEQETFRMLLLTALFVVSV
jgi:hypothetical protein